MNYFSKKTSIILTALSFVCIVIAVVFTVFTHQFIDFSYTFFSQKIFHREFELEKWLPTIQSFFILPAFVVVSVNSLLFHKYSNQFKYILLGLMTAAIVFACTYASLANTMRTANSDLACELVLAKECIAEKSIIPTGYIYSTELHFINNQWVNAPFFLFTDNWNVVKALSSIVQYILLCVCTFYLLTKLEIKELWLKILCCLFSFTPFSGLIWYCITWGMYYVPHILFEFLYVALFIQIIKNNNCKKIYKILFLALGFLSGLSTIRYIMLFQFPLTLACFIFEINRKDKQYSIADFKNFWLKNPVIFYGILGLFAGGFGYVCNNLVLQKIYIFHQWSTIQFNAIGDVPLLSIVRSILNVYGYQANIAVLTPSGVLNVLMFVGIGLFIYLVYESLKKDLPFYQKFYLVFVACAILFNTFVYYNTELIARYYVPLLAITGPAFAIIIENSQIYRLKRYALGVIWTIVLLSSSFTTIQDSFNGGDSEDRVGYVKYLTDHNYDFGFATFWNANITTMLTNGKIEVGNLECTDDNDDTKLRFTEKYAYREWSTPKRYYNNEHQGKHIFLLLNELQYQGNKDHPLVENGKLVYQDSEYYIFDYDSFAAFRDAYNN